MAPWFANGGVRKDELNELQVVATSGMVVNVNSGNAWVQSQYFSHPAAVGITLTGADPSNPRIDRIVIHIDWALNTITLIALTGTAAGSPSAPSLTRTGTIWEYSLAQIAVSAGTTSIITGNITDERNNPNVCGYSYSPYPTAICVSTAKPTAFAIGGLIYTTDESKVYVNTGTNGTPAWTALLTSSSTTYAAPALTLGVSNVQGAANSSVRTDATILAFDATNPTTAAVGDSPAVGAATVAARRDHGHGMPAFVVTPSTQAFGDAPAGGAATTIARGDHKHGMPAAPTTFAAPALTLSTTNSAGVAATAVRSDATIAVFDAAAPSVQAFGDSATVGVAAAAARRDHKHGMPTGAANVAVDGGTTLASSVAETTIETHALGVLAGQRAYLTQVAGTYLNNTGGNTQLIIKVKFVAATTVTALSATIPTIVANAAYRDFYLELFTYTLSTGTQFVYGKVILGALNSWVNGAGTGVMAAAFFEGTATAAPAVDASGGLTITVTAQHDTNSANCQLTTNGAHTTRLA